MAKIRHIAMFTEEPEKLAAFYVDVFGMTITQRMPWSKESGSAIFLSDGYLDFALIAPSVPKPKGINHFGFTCESDEMPDIVAKLKTYGLESFVPPPDRPYVEQAVHDVDGNRFDLSTTGLRPAVSEASNSPSVSLSLPKN